MYSLGQRFANTGKVGALNLLCSKNGEHDYSNAEDIEVRREVWIIHKRFVVRENLRSFTNKFVQASMDFQSVGGTTTNLPTISNCTLTAS